MMNQKFRVRFHIAKRMIDIFVSLCLLVVLSPILLLIAVWIKLDSPGSVLYTSERMGKNGRPFTLLKFRSMYEGSSPLYGDDGSMLVRDNDPRVTRVGRLLRSGFDELPQLLNVLWGQMSLIGPRADPPEAARLYPQIERDRLCIKPGISGLAQVNGRTQIPLAKRHQYDLTYIEKQSAQLDTCIGLLTFFEVLPLPHWGGDHVQKKLSKMTDRLIKL